tara:strand:+ start:504 stop:1187 length:684 start_codon:yes stop_codon:yes gene_type:complete
MRIKEIYPTIQGEGSKAGTPAVFVRFSGCNLWSGKEESRHKGSGVCAQWCDTDFYKGEKLSYTDIIKTLDSLTKNWDTKTVIFTGGEPTLQLMKTDGEALISHLLRNAWTVGIETNGTIDSNKCKMLDILNWSRRGHITVSPKPLVGKGGDISHLKLREGTDLKVIVPTEFDLKELKEKTDFVHYYIQPMDTGDGSKGRNNLDLAMDLATKYGYCVSVQTHKLVNLP